MARTYRRLRRTAADTNKPKAEPLDLTAFRAELRVQIKQALNAPADTVTLLRPPPGAGKSYITSEEISNLPDDRKVVVFAQTHALAKAEWEDRIPGSLRLMSLSQMVKEGRLESDGERIECPFAGQIAAAQSKSLPYLSYYCSQRCPFQAGCSYHQRKKEAESTRVLICPHAFIPTLAKTGLTDDRIVVIDECAAPFLRTRIEFSQATMESFRHLLADFEATGEADAAVLTALRRILAGIEAVPVGESRTMDDSGAVLFQSDAFRAKFNQYLNDCRPSGWNLFPDIKDIAVFRRFVRCSKPKADPIRWAIRPNLPSNDQPFLILDATGTRALYEALFPDRKVVVWPEDDRKFAPKSDVTVFIDGAYPQQSLWDTTGETPKASKCFSGIMDHAEKIVEHHAADPKSIGFVTLMKLVPSVKARFPGVPSTNILHYGDLRGRNEIKTCALVFIIGCQPPSLYEIAEAAVTMFGLDRDPASLIGNMDAQRQFQGLEAQEGGFEVKQFSFSDPHMRLAWQALVTAEVAQAAGRSRAHDNREIVQRVFVFTNVDIGMPATRILTRREHLKSIGCAVPTRADDVYDAIQTLAMAGKRFGYSEIVSLTGIELKKLKAPAYQAAIKQAVADFGIAQSGRPKRFEKEAA